MDTDQDLSMAGSVVVVLVVVVVAILVMIIQELQENSRHTRAHTDKVIYPT